jgi:two-component system cell cycle response regulator
MLPNALLLKSYMKQIEGLESLTFTDPEAALAQCSATAPDLVLLDYHMPQMNGVEFVTRFRSIAHLKDIPIVMITGEEKKEALYEALQAGANDFLRKPVDAVELITRARNLLELRARQRDLAAANGQLYVLATTDQLTGLKNRRYFIERLEIEVERTRRHHQKCAVAILDADHFKSVNDTHGHDAGDKVLQTLASLLVGDLRAIDLVGRIGGEEFALLLPETTPNDALDVCHRILARIRGAKVPIEGGEIEFSASIGLTGISDVRDEADAVLKRADQALYRAKAGGRNRCEVAGFLSAASGTDLVGMGRRAA